MEGKVLSCRRKDSPGNMAEAGSLNLVAGRGIEGDHHFDDENPMRQILLMSQEVLDEVGYSHGLLREQITVSFPGLQQLPEGQRLNIGSAIIEITSDCAPCLYMADQLGEQPKLFVEKMLKKRGMLARVLESGTVRPGDALRTTQG